ncbi:MAG: phospholipase, partial [Verrucomicrobia bacterium]
YVEKSDNPDIADFRGYGDYGVSLEHARRLKIAATLRVGTGGHASVLVDASYPLRALFSAVRYGYLHVQYFNGYGETLRSYDQRGPWQVRVGLMLVR